MESSIIKDYYSKVSYQDRKATFIQCYAPTNDADDGTKTDFNEKLQGVIDGVAIKDLILLGGDFNAKVGSNNTSFDIFMGNKVSPK